MTEQIALMPEDKVVAVPSIGTLQPAPAIPTIYEMVYALVRDPNVDPARIAQFMEIQERAENRNAEKEFIAAMTRLQPRLPRIGKDGSIDLGRGKPMKFAKFESIDRIIRPLLTEEGFSISFGTAPHDKGITITATLSHAAGHSRTESMPLPFDTGPGRNNLQAVGSTISYGKRYLVCAMLNLITVGDDDDGNASSAITRDQQDNIEALITECGLTSEARSKFMEMMGVKAISDIQQGGYKAAINILVAKRRKVGEGVA